MSDDALWTSDDMAQAMGASVIGTLPSIVSGLSIDSRTIKVDEAYFAILGDTHDGHAFVEPALASGAALAVVSQEKAGTYPDLARLLVVEDVLDGLRALARAARTRSKAKIIGVTGSVGKTSTKEALRVALSTAGETHASVASFNNHWGVPLSLARCPRSARFAIFEMGMNHPGEITPLTRLVRPHIAIVTTVEPVHLEFFPSVEAIADAKAEIFEGLEPGGAVILNRDNAQFARLAAHATEHGIAHIVSFGEHEEAHARLVDCKLQPDCSIVTARILGTDVTYKLGAPGRHIVMNSLAVLAAVKLAGADLALAALALAGLQPPSGRGERMVLTVDGGTATLIDESYNANPASMRAAIALLGQTPVSGRGRRIAVLGDMLELGEKGTVLHAELAGPVVDNAIDLVFCAGPLMAALWDALPFERRGGYAETAAALEADLLAAVHPGDAIMVKGSLGSRMAPLVKALVRHYPVARPPTERAEQV